MLVETAIRHSCYELYARGCGKPFPKIVPKLWQNSTFLQLGFGLPWSKRLWFSMEITVEAAISGNSITLGDIWTFGLICCWLKLTFFLSFGGVVFAIGFETSWGVVMDSEIISDVAVTATGWIWKSICGVIWKTNVAWISYVSNFEYLASLSFLTEFWYLEHLQGIIRVP